MRMTREVFPRSDSRPKAVGWSRPVTVLVISQRGFTRFGETGHEANKVGVKAVEATFDYSSNTLPHATATSRTLGPCSKI